MGDFLMIGIVPADKAVAKYLLVQYMRDTRRMESKNIGVIVWTPGAAECRFVSSDKAGEVVNDTKNFDRWVTFWKNRVGKETLEHHGDIADIKSQEYYELLLRTWSQSTSRFEPWNLNRRKRRAEPETPSFPSCPSVQNIQFKSGCYSGPSPKNSERKLFLGGGG